MSKTHIYTSMDEFRAHINIAPFSLSDVSEGSWTRWPRADRSSRDRACYLRKYPDGFVFGGNWETGRIGLYSSSGRCRPNDRNRLIIESAMADHDLERAKQEAARKQDARTMCERFFQSGITTRLMAHDAANPYLMRKGLGAVDANLWRCRAEDASRFMAEHLGEPGYRLWGSRGKPLAGDCLVVPLSQPVGDVINGIQLIDETGNKTILRGSVMSGNGWYAHPDDVYRRARRIGVGEGVATVLTVNRVFDLPVVAAMSCTNLKAVALEVKRTYPMAHLVILSDRDKSGAGQKKAQEAAQAVGGAMTFPTWTKEDEIRHPSLVENPPTDFNDYYLAIGLLQEVNK